MRFFNWRTVSKASLPEAVLKIVHYPHPTLRHRSLPIRRVDKELRDIAAQMLDLMYEAEGVGLAANQVDLPIRLFVANPSGQKGEGEELILLNPELQMPKGNETSQEGCTHENRRRCRF